MDTLANPEPSAEDSMENRVLILAPTGRDALLASQILRNMGMTCRACADEADLCREFGEGAAVARSEESGVGPQFASFRYFVWNTSGSGARGKYQMMPGTYASRAKYGDWSPLDQEIAGRREFFANGTGPWEACH